MKRDISRFDTSNRLLSNKISSKQKIYSTTQYFLKCARTRYLSNKITSEQKIYSTAQCFSKCTSARLSSNKISLTCQCQLTRAPIMENLRFRSELRDSDWRVSDYDSAHTFLLSWIPSGICFPTIRNEHK